jgi:Sulfotransferase domain
MDQRPPDFLVVGAMKSATTTLHEQLARQPGLFMCRPKEPNFFSDDAVYARGLDWYWSLFREAGDAFVCGESSTHYTKLPTYPRTLERMRRALPRVKLVYVMRHPIDRLVSHYVHERTLDAVPGLIEEAIDTHPELVDYSRYSYQLRSYLDAYGWANVLPVFFGRLILHPQEELERICRFIGYPKTPRWDTSLRPQNVSSERLRKSPLREALVKAPVLTAIRKRIVPKPWTEPVKALWRAKYERPHLPAHVWVHLKELFDPDLAELGSWLGISLDCDSFVETTEARAYRWACLGKDDPRAPNSP